jgi:hypothetical protein
MGEEVAQVEEEPLILLKLAYLIEDTRKINENFIY